jgi:hypothetical protein
MAFETQPSKTPPMVPSFEEHIGEQWAETCLPLFWVMMLVACVWSELRGREHPQGDPALLRSDSSDEDFRAFAAEALRGDPTAQFGPVLSRWRGLHAEPIPLRDSLRHVFDEERHRSAG